MEKVLRCKDVGIDCSFEARGKTLDEVLKKAADHARKEHGVKRVTQDYLKSWKKLVKNV
jgi:predicted small metal-binding protein